MYAICTQIGKYNNSPCMADIPYCLVRYYSPWHAVQVLLRTEVHTLSATWAGFKLMTYRSWQYSSCHWDAWSNYLAIGDSSQLGFFTLYFTQEPHERLIIAHILIVISTQIILFFFNIQHCIKAKCTSSVSGQATWSKCFHQPGITITIVNLI